MYRHVDAIWSWVGFGILRDAVFYGVAPLLGVALHQMDLVIRMDLDVLGGLSWRMNPMPLVLCKMGTVQWRFNQATREVSLCTWIMARSWPEDLARSWLGPPRGPVRPEVAAR